MIRRRGVLGILIVILLVLVMAASAQAAGPRRGHTPGIETIVSSWDRYFEKIADNGFASETGNFDYYRHNNYAWSMEEFNGELYVGTGRSVDTFNIMWETLWAAMQPGVRPPELPDVAHPPFLQDFLQKVGPAYLVTDKEAFREWVSVSQAEIWRYDNRDWERVYQAPKVDSFLRTSTGTIPEPRYKVAQTSGFRSMITFTDNTGVEALYAASGGFSLAISSPMLYRTTNGDDWETLATPAAMGRETRAMAVLNGKLYVGVGGRDGSGGATPAVWCNDDPTDPTGWVQVMNFDTLDSTNLGVKVMCDYNGLLYVGTQNQDGFQVWRSTSGNPTSNADWVRVVADGAGDRYNVNAQTMQVFNGLLYVSTVSLPFLSGYPDMKGFEIIRIFPDDTWQLVMGARNPVDSPGPMYDNRTPISGWPAGFGNPMAFYGWSMEAYNGFLFVGNLDTTVFLRYLDDYEGDIPDIPNLDSMVAAAEKISGCDLWCSPNGYLWLPVTIDGFNTPENYGFRTMKATSMGLFLGTANPFTGCEIWQGSF